MEELFWSVIGGLVANFLTKAIEALIKKFASWSK